MTDRTGETGTSMGEVPLEALAALAESVGATELAAEARALAERVAEGRFYVACVGQFKRGKSTLLNALVGRPILPSGIVPVTSVPTVLRHGARPAARVRLDAAARGSGGWVDVPVDALERYVSEEHNPENELGVRAVEVFVPAPLLESGLCLVDTPGIGSVFAGNTAATRAFVPHVDAALVVVGVDPPLGGDELALIESVAAHAPSLLVVLNKADRFGDAERAEAARFTERVLSARLGRAVGAVYQVSATERLAGDPTPRDWLALTEALRALVTSSGGRLVCAARDRGTARLAAATRAEIAEQRGALTRPVTESERRLAALGRCVSDAAQRALELGHLFAAEQRRLGRRFAARREAFLAEAVPAAQTELRQAIAALPERRGPRLREAALGRARAIGRRRLEPWLAAEQRAAENAYRDVATHFVALANGFLEQGARAGGGGGAGGDDALERLPRAIESEAGFRVPSRYYFRELHPLTYGSPVRTLLDLVRGRPSMLRAVERDAAAYLGELLVMNSTLVENDLDERVTESRRRLEAELQGMLRAVYVAVERALVRARGAHEAGAHAVAAEVGRLDALRRELDALGQGAGSAASAEGGGGSGRQLPVTWTGQLPVRSDSGTSAR